MRIIHILTSSTVGGLEQAYVNMSVALQKLGHEVMNLCPQNAPYVAQLPNDIQHIHFKPKGFYDVISAYKLHRQIKKLNADIIIAHNSRAVQVAHWARFCTNVPLIGFSHSAKINRIIKADHVVVLTKEMYEACLVAGKSENNVDIFPNMITNFPEKPLPMSDDGKTITLGFMGRLVQLKGIDDLLDAFVALKNKIDYDLRLSIAGDGEYAQLIREFSQKNNLENDIVMHGWISDVRQWFSEIDIAVFPSRSESFGLTVLEAHMHGRPVISTFTDGPQSQIENGVTGFLVEPEQPVQLADAIAEMIHRKNEWPVFIQRGFASAQRYEMHNLLPRLEEILQKVLLKSSGHIR